MNILLVEDEYPKRQNIQKFLENLPKDINIRFAQSVNSALDELEDEIPDLMILDMSLPTFDITDEDSGGRPQGFGGEEVLRVLLIQNIICRTIVITGYESFLKDDGMSLNIDKLRSTLKSEFNEYIIDVIHYNSTNDSWKTHLKKYFE
ncbi:response regulator [Acinetobacter tianfuensis]|uniref:Response regulator n=1 Tax=Acinetobacter tianfuensis TaxID=2419603 RepID=A0A3A8E6L9_9GAMM|nr:response regulator [Acinetobacter tianfuensis]RKG29809.1 response regulator [Acinetobacter tianfuensis]